MKYKTTIYKQPHKRTGFYYIFAVNHHCNEVTAYFAYDRESSGLYVRRAFGVNYGKARGIELTFEAIHEELLSQNYEAILEWERDDDCLPLDGSDTIEFKLNKEGIADSWWEKLL